MLSTTPKCCDMPYGKIYVLDKLCSGMSYSAIDHELTVKRIKNAYSVRHLKQKHTENVVLY